MKKIMFALMCTVFSIAAIAQTTTPTLSNQEIAKTINMSKEANISNGVLDPNKIYVGQHLTFLFTDNTRATIVVEKGDNQWNILRNKIAELVKVHGDVVPYVAPPVVDPAPKTTPPAAATVSFLDSIFSGNAWAVWLIVGAIVLGLFLLSRWIKATKQNPVTSGRPMRDNGVNDESAREYAQQVANRQYAGANLTVTNITKGRITATRANVLYADKPNGKTRTFTNEPGYRGTINRAGVESFVYFLQGCGNDVRMGNYFSGDIQFVADEAQPQVLTTPTAAPVQEQTVPVVINNTPEQLTAIITAITEPLKTKDSGSINVTMADGVKIEMNFASGTKTETLITPAGSNHVAEEKHQQQ